MFALFFPPFHDGGDSFRRTPTDVMYVRIVMGIQYSYSPRLILSVQVFFLCAGK